MRWARSATKHRISRERTRFVIEHAAMRFRIPPPEGSRDERLLYLGIDADGAPLEIMAVELDAGELYVIAEEVPSPVRGGSQMAKLKTKAGTTLTRDQTEDLAAEAERGYDLTKATREPAKGGRPPLEDGVSPRISYRVGDTLYRRTKAKAKTEGRTVSEVARAALEQYVGR